ncbi:MAG: phosphoenolpyruvate--protein phosphotransferase [Fibrobacteraceae bacterium]|nr:phosphoenolpyruvate--protein phosphotransferase [Fibrobacteraceae bacterium]
MTISMKNQPNSSLPRYLINGLATSPGYAMGRVYKIAAKEFTIVEETITEEAVESELRLFRQTMEKTFKEITKIKESTLERVGQNEARIFDSHLMILKDPSLTLSIQQSVSKEHKSLRWSIHSSITALIQQFESIDSEMMRERALDLRDLYNRIFSILDEAAPTFSVGQFSEPVIFVGHELTPSILISIKSDNVLAFATDSGGRTSHASILARAMQVPSVSGLRNISALAHDGDMMIVDGTLGIIILNPNEDDIADYHNKQDKYRQQQRELFTMRQLEPMTRDGKFITLHANIELPQEAEKVQDFGATGIGLYRSEFLFFGNTLPTVEEQCEAYKHILNSLAPNPVTIRTLDAGGDKLVSEISISNEANPFMGWRSIRVCLDREDIFREQLKALLQANEKGNLRILLPMISGLPELRRSKELIKTCQAELEEEGITTPSVEVGIMIEVPAAVMQVEQLAKEADFFSIGTNDLIQFTLAVDRSNEMIADMFQPHHPAILNMIYNTVIAAHKEGIPVAVCGEMSADPFSILLLIGLGVDELSMTPWSIMEAKKIIRSINYEDVNEIALHALHYDDAACVDSFLHKRFAQAFADLGITSYVPAQKAK